jgi:hypothetical protein
MAAAGEVSRYGILFSVDNETFDTYLGVEVAGVILRLGIDETKKFVDSILKIMLEASVMSATLKLMRDREMIEPDEVDAQFESLLKIYGYKRTEKSHV